MSRHAICRTPSVLALVWALCLFVPAAPVAAWDGQLDSNGFHAPNGYVLFSSTSADAHSGVVAPDGAVVAIGMYDGVGIYWARLTASGAPATCNFVPPQSDGAGGWDGVFDEEGRLVITGTAWYTSLGQVLFVARFLYPACELDPTFDGDGYWTLDAGDNLIGLKIATVRVPSPIPGFFLERLLVAGDSRPVAGSDLSDLLLIRLRSNGTLDSTFGSGGVAVYDFDAESNFLADLAIDAAGRIVLGGSVDLFGASPDAMAMRALPDGTLDDSFGAFGWVRWNCGTSPGEDQPAAVAVDTGGNVRVLSRWLFQNANGSTHGLCGADLGVDGQTVTRQLLANLGDAALNVRDAVLQGDGRLIVIGDSDVTDDTWDPFAVAFRLPDWTVDPTWNNGAGAWLEYPFDLVQSGVERARAIVLDAGRPVILGSAQTAPGMRAFAFRLENAYIFADGFERGSTAAW